MVLFKFKLDVILFIKLGDHVIALNDKGEVFAMGDDTYGQCGQADTDRNTNPPFSERRIKYPIKVVKFINYIEKYKRYRTNCSWN